MSVVVKLSQMNLAHKHKDLLRPIYYYIKNIRHKKELIRNAALKNKYLNKRCFVFGTGLSLLDIDLSFFKNEHTFGCNSLFMHPSFKQMDINFFSIIGSLFELSNSPVPWDLPDILFPKVENACKGVATPRLFFDVSAKNYINKKKYFSNLPITYVASKVNDNFDNLKIYDLDKPNDFMLGSHYFMIAASIYMGYKEIYLLGAGYTYQPIHRCHFYDNEKALEAAKLMENTSVDFRNYDLKNIAEICGVQIYNVVPDGFESPIYDTIRLKDVYTIIK